MCALAKSYTQTEVIAGNRESEIIRQAVFAICILNLALGLGVILFSVSSIEILGAYGGFSVLWSIVMALMLVLLSYSSWKDEEVLMNILYRLDRSFPSPEEDEMTKLGKEVMDSIMKTVDVPHYEKAKILVDSYLKDGCLRPELALNDGLREKMRVGLTMERAIEELYNERGLNV